MEKHYLLEHIGKFDAIIPEPESNGVLEEFPLLNHHLR